MKFPLVLTRRTFILAIIYSVLFFILIGRLFYLQIIMGKVFKRLSDNNRLDSIILIPNRGLILDRKDHRLTVNTTQYQLLVSPKYITNLQQLILQLQSLIHLSKKSLKVLQSIPNKSKYFDVMIKDQLSWKEVSIIDFYHYKLNGVKVSAYIQRYYPYGEQCINIIGYVGFPTKSNMKKNIIYKEPGVLIGKTNVEKSWNTKLFGKYGVRTDEVDAKGNLVKVMNIVPKKNGENIVLASLLEVQNKMHQSLKSERAGASIVMNIHTGEILALDSVPSINPNLFLQGVSLKQWKEWKAMQSSPFINRAVGEGFSPGSTFKIVSALALLKYGISIYETVVCPGYFNFGGRRFYCWKRTGHGIVDFHKSIVESCDVYYYKMSLKFGINALSNMARILGFAESYDLGLDGIIKGIIPSKAWKLATFGVPWRLGETLNSSIGQGYITVSVLQLAVMMSRVASGKIIKPNLLKQKDSLSQYSVTIDIPQKHLDLVMKALVGVVNSAHGTARFSRFSSWGMGGKTGTAQVRSGKGDRSKETDESKIAWKYRDNSIFVGFFPKYKPKFAIATLIEHGGSGAAAAAHITRDIAKGIEKIYKNYHGNI